MTHAELREGLDFLRHKIDEMRLLLGPREADEDVLREIYERQGYAFVRGHADEWLDAEERKDDQTADLFEAQGRYVDNSPEATRARNNLPPRGRSS